MLTKKIATMLRKLAGWPEPDAGCGACASKGLPETAGRTGAPPAGEADFSLRPAIPSDLAAARLVVAGCSLPTPGMEEQFEEQYAVAVAGGSGEVVGVAGYEVYGPYGLFRSAAVDPAWRGRGVGAALTRDRIAAAEARGLEALYALTTTAAEHFPRFGFRPIDRAAVPEPVRTSSEFAELCPSSATALRLDLGAPRPARGESPHAALGPFPTLEEWPDPSYIKWYAGFEGTTPGRTSSAGMPHYWIRTALRRGMAGRDRDGRPCKS